MGEGWIRAMISAEAVEEFKRLYFREHGMKLTNEQAVDMGNKLIRLVKVVFGPNLPEEWKPQKLDSVGPKKVR
ncbi:MAG: hypothetical protein G01um10147_240 [Microgenomates group bacterium Gr01-1014_7]|nr:MAG: hypothetical protein G01um10147_240 [Microgenomates group bacterium Gr01-1014_7]